MVYQENILITLDSTNGKLRNGTMKSLIDFNFIGLLKDEKDILRSYISVLNAQIPVSFYTITVNNYKLKYVVGGSTFRTIFITPGNYNGNSLITALIDSFANNGDIITASLSSSTGKLFIRSYSGSITYVYNTSTIAPILGLTADISGITVTFQAPLNLLGVKKLSIKSNSLAISSFTSRTGNRTDTICTIPVIEPPFNMISYVNMNDLNKNILRGQIIDSIDIRITDEDNNDIDFNNIDWNITLCLSNERIDKEKQNINIYEAIKQMGDLQNNMKSDNKKLIDEELQLLEK
jgi:hypothetical protein